MIRIAIVLYRTPNYQIFMKFVHFTAYTSIRNTKAQVSDLDVAGIDVIR